MNRFTPVYTRGDAGGNAFKLPYRYRVKSLHSLWDKVLYEERYNIRRPIDDEDWSEIQTDIDRMLDEHLDQVLAMDAFGPDNPYVYQQTDFDDWSEEGWELAKIVFLE